MVSGALSFDGLFDAWAKLEVDLNAAVASSAPR